MQITTVPINELAEFYALYWINSIQNGRLEMPFRGDNSMTKLANIARATQTANFVKVFSDEQVEMLVARTKEIINKDLSLQKNLYGYTAYSNPHALLEKIFKGTEIPHGRFPFEEAVCYCYSKEDYKGKFQDRWPQKDKDRRVNDYPGGDNDGVLCRYLSGGGWEIIAVVKS